MASDTPARPLQPTVEDYDSDESNGHVLSANFPRKASPAAQANVSTKRSKDLNEPPAAQDRHKTPADVRSDSGYSSYTAASKSSADSATSHPAPPVQPAPAVARSPAPRPRRPTASEHRQQTSESSPRPKGLSRTASVSSKQQRPAVSRRPTITRQQDAAAAVDADCNDPNCTECGPHLRPRRRERERERDREEPPTASALAFASLPSDQVSQRSDPNPYYNPPSPTYTRNPYQQPAAIIQPHQSRRRSSSTVRPRPQSYAGGDPSAGYWAPGVNISGYPSPPQEPHGPPLSMSAYQNMHYPNMGPYMGQPSQPMYYSGSANQTSPPYDNPRPQLSARGPSYNNPSRNSLPPVITQDAPSKYSARFGQPPTPSESQMRIPRQNRITQAPHDDEESSSEDEDAQEAEYYEAQRSRALARALMPPPDLPEKRSKSKRRPTLTHANTTPVVDPRDRRQSFIVPERPKQLARERERDSEREREREKLPRMNTAPARRQSISRPPLHRKSQSEYDTQYAQVVVNNSARPSRRPSYQGQSQGQTYERTIEKALRQQAKAKAQAEAQAFAEQQHQAELKRQRRASRVITTDRHIPGEFVEDNYEEEEKRPLSRPRRKTDAELRKGKERTLEPSFRAENAANAAEEYINSTRGSRAPYADSVSKAAKRASRIPSGPSESGSSNSNGSGKQSVSQRTTMTSGANNEIRLRVDASAPIALSFNGDMEGRTLQLLPAENGMTDVVIGNRENNYQGETDSIVRSHRKSILGSQPRREAEDLISERSTRSSRSRRERDDARIPREERDERHVLRRTRPTTYHRN